MSSCRRIRKTVIDSCGEKGTLGVEEKNAGGQRRHGDSEAGMVRFPTSAKGGRLDIARVSVTTDAFLGGILAT